MCALAQILLFTLVHTTVRLRGEREGGRGSMAMIYVQLVAPSIVHRRANGEGDGTTLLACTTIRLSPPV
jgi:hypothetical protein